MTTTNILLETITIINKLYTNSTYDMYIRKASELL